MAWFWSMLTLTMRTLPLCERTTFSRIGVSCLQGSHQGAQKSTSTGALREASSTSLAKLAMLASLMTSGAAAGVSPALPKRKSMSISESRLQAPYIGRFGRLFSLGHRKDARLVPAGADERQQVVPRDVGGRGILQRVVVQM